MPRQAECTSKSEEERCFAAPLVYSPSWSGPDDPLGYPRSGGNRSFLERQGRSESKGKAAALFVATKLVVNPSRDAIWLLEVLVVPVDVLSFSLQQDAWPKRVRGSQTNRGLRVQSALVDVLAGRSATRGH